MKTDDDRAPKALKKSSSTTSLRGIFSRKGSPIDDVPPVPPIPARYAQSSTTSGEKFPSLDVATTHGPEQTKSSSGHPDNFMELGEQSTSAAVGAFKAPPFAQMDPMGVSFNMHQLADKKTQSRLGWLKKKSSRNLRSYTTSSKTTSSSGNTSFEHPRTVPLPQAGFGTSPFTAAHTEPRDSERMLERAEADYRRHGTASSGTTQHASSNESSSLRNVTPASQKGSTPSPFQKCGRYEPRGEVFEGVGRVPPPNLRAPPQKYPVRVQPTEHGGYVSKAVMPPGLPSSDVAEVNEAFWKDAVEYAKESIREEEEKDKLKAEEDAAAAREPTAEEIAAKEAETRQRDIERGIKLINRTSTLGYAVNYQAISDTTFVDDMACAGATLQHLHMHPNDKDTEQGLKNFAARLIRALRGTPRQNPVFSPSAFPKPPKPGSKEKSKQKKAIQEPVISAPLIVKPPPVRQELRPETRQAILPKTRPEKRPEIRSESRQEAGQETRQYGYPQRESPQSGCLGIQLKSELLAQSDRRHGESAEKKQVIQQQGGSPLSGSRIPRPSNPSGRQKFSQQRKMEHASPQQGRPTMQPTTPSTKHAYSLGGDSSLFEMDPTPSKLVIPTGRRVTPIIMSSTPPLGNNRFFDRQISREAQRSERRDALASLQHPAFRGLRDPTKINTSPSSPEPNIPEGITPSKPSRHAAVLGSVLEQTSSKSRAKPTGQTKVSDYFRPVPLEQRYEETIDVWKQAPDQVSPTTGAPEQLGHRSQQEIEREEQEKQAVMACSKCNKLVMACARCNSIFCADCGDICAVDKCNQPLCKDCTKVNSVCPHHGIDDPEFF